VLIDGSQEADAAKAAGKHDINMGRVPLLEVSFEMRATVSYPCCFVGARECDCLLRDPTWIESTSTFGYLLAVSIGRWRPDRAVEGHRPLRCEEMRLDSSYLRSVQHGPMLVHARTRVARAVNLVYRAVTGCCASFWRPLFIPSNPFQVSSEPQRSRLLRLMPSASTSA